MSTTVDERVIHEERWVVIAFAALLGVDVAVVAVLMWSMGASPALAASVLVILIVTPLLALWVISRLLWLPWQRLWPAREAEPDAVARAWQSFTFGRVARFNHCLCVVVDSNYLHVRPLPVMRWFGAQTISLPWDRMQDFTATRIGDMMRATIDQRRITGPRWAMQIGADAD